MATRLSENEVLGIFEKVSNWGRWGKDDERGALNFITDKKRAAAAKLVQSGEIVSLAQPLATIPGPDNPTPVTHLVAQSGHDAHDAAYRGTAKRPGTVARSAAEPGLAALP